PEPAGATNRPRPPALGTGTFRRDAEPRPPRQVSELCPPGRPAHPPQSRHPPTRSQRTHPPRWHDRSPPKPSPVSFVPFDIWPEHPLASTEPACSSNSREETAATPA